MSTTHTREELERRRCRAAALLDAGWSQEEVAEELGVTHGAVSQWAKARRAGGDEALRSKPHPGRKPKLDETELQRLEELLLRGPRAHGWATELWTLPRIVQLIEHEFGVRYDPSGVWHVLRRMGFSCQRPEHRARERDEQAIAGWRKRDWPRIKKARGGRGGASSS